MNVTLQQPYDMGSAYNNPKYTNFTTGFAACLDYIFFEKNKLRVVQVRQFDIMFFRFRSLYIYISIPIGCAITRRRRTEAINSHSIYRFSIRSYIIGS